MSNTIDARPKRTCALNVSYSPMVQCGVSKFQKVTEEEYLKKLAKQAVQEQASKGSVIDSIDLTMSASDDDEQESKSVCGTNTSPSRNMLPLATRGNPRSNNEVNRAIYFFYRNMRTGPQSFRRPSFGRKTPFALLEEAKVEYINEDEEESEQGQEEVEEEAEEEAEVEAEEKAEEEKQGDAGEEKQGDAGEVKEDQEEVGVVEKKQKKRKKRKKGKKQQQAGDELAQQQKPGKKQKKPDKVEQVQDHQCSNDQEKKKQRNRRKRLKRKQKAKERMAKALAGLPMVQSPRDPIEDAYCVDFLACNNDTLVEGNLADWESIMEILQPLLPDDVEAYQQFMFKLLQYVMKTCIIFGQGPKFDQRNVQRVPYFIDYRDGPSGKVHYRMFFNEFWDSITKENPKTFIDFFMDLMFFFTNTRTVINEEGTVFINGRAQDNQDHGCSLEDMTYLFFMINHVLLSDLCQECSFKLPEKSLQRMVFTTVKQSKAK